MSGSAGSAPLPFQLARSGISPDLVARMIGLGGKGMGGAGGVAAMARGATGTIGFAESEGLRGDKISEMLARISASTTQLAEQGMALDPGAVTSFMSGVSGIGRGKGPGGTDLFGGMNATRAATTLTGMGAGAVNKGRQPFADMGNSLLMAQAFSESDTYMEAMGKMEDWTGDPDQVRRKMVQAGGSEAASFAMFGGGMGSRQATALGGRSGRIKGGVRHSTGTATTDGLAYSQAFAEQQSAMMSQAGGMAGNTQFIKAVTELNTTMMKLAKDGDDIVEAFREMLQNIL